MKRKIIISSLLIILILFISLPNFAATIVIPQGTKFDKISISQSYEQCLKMKSEPGEVLYGTNVHPHLTTNTDWGIVSYFSYSKYGINAQNDIGIAVNIDGREYLSTNGNETGIMDWGKTPTQTAALDQAYMSNPVETYKVGNGDVLQVKSNVYMLYDEINANSRFVEKLGSDKTGMAMSETSGMTANSGGGTSGAGLPVAVRVKLFQVNPVNNWYSNYMCGGKWSNVTFRPIVWNY